MKAACTFAALASMICLASSCASLPEGLLPASSNLPSRTADSRNPTGDRPGAPLKAKGFDTLWNLDQYPMNVFYGIASPSGNREAMAAEALYRCARSVAISEHLYVSTGLVTETSGSQLQTFATRGEAVYDEGSVEGIAARLKTLEAIEGPEGLLLVAEDPAKTAAPRPDAGGRDDSGRPLWVDNPPRLQGFIAAVGETRGYRYLKDSLEAADIAAAYALMESSADTITEARSYSETATMTGQTRTEEAGMNGVFQLSRGNIKGFYVLARWFDARNNIYYTLAVCPV